MPSAEKGDGLKIEMQPGIDGGVIPVNGEA